MWQPCIYCSGAGSTGSLTTGNRQSCLVCFGRGGASVADSSGVPSGRTPIGWLDKRRTPKERDKSFAALIGVLAGTWLLWVGYSRGFGGERIWDFVGPVMAAILLTKILETVTIVIRPLRWLTIAALWAALGYAALLLFRMFY